MCLWAGTFAVSAAESLRSVERVHDPSTIVKCGRDYWCFATGPGVASRRSTNLMHWESGPRVFTGRHPWATDVVADHRSYFWAPDVIEHRGRFLLYYSVSSWGKKTSAIGLATNPTLDPDDSRYRWTDAGIVIQTGDRDDFNAIDPNVVLDAEGRLWLAFGSFWSGIKMVELDPATGKRLATNSPVHSLAHHEAIEAPCITRHGDHYILFVNWGQCCKGTNSTYEIRMGRSARITGPYLDQEGRDLLHGGGTLLLKTSGRFVGPGHAGVLRTQDGERLSFHFYNRDRWGTPNLALRRLEWSAEGWPVVRMEE